MRIQWGPFLISATSAPPRDLFIPSRLVVCIQRIIGRSPRILIWSVFLCVDYAAGGLPQDLLCPYWKSVVGIRTKGKPTGPFPTKGKVEGATSRSSVWKAYLVLSYASHHIFCRLCRSIYHASIRSTTLALSWDPVHHHSCLSTSVPKRVGNIGMKFT